MNKNMNKNGINTHLPQPHTHSHRLNTTTHAMTRGNDDAYEIQLLSSSHPQTSSPPPLFRRIQGDFGCHAADGGAHALAQPCALWIWQQARASRPPFLADQELPTPTSLPPVKPQPGTRAVNPAAGAVTRFTPVPAVSSCESALISPHLQLDTNLHNSFAVL